MNGLRVSEAAGAGIEHLGIERGHRTLTVTRKGGKIVIIPSRRAPPVRSTWTSGERPDGLVFLAPDGRGWTGTAPPGWSGGSPGARHRQAGRAEHATARVHHHRAGRRRAMC
jgi:hypothetical protein